MSESNAWIARLVEEVSLAIAVVDPAGKPIFANKLARDVLEVDANPALGLALCGELEDQVREAHEDGLEKQGILLSCERDGTQWRGAVRPLDAARIGLVFHREPTRDRPLERLCCELGLEASEARVALRIAEGLSNPEIAERFAISVSAAKSRVWMLCRKLGTRNRAALAALISTTLATSAGNGEGLGN